MNGSSAVSPTTPLCTHTPALHSGCHEPQSYAVPRPHNIVYQRQCGTNCHRSPHGWCEGSADVEQHRNCPPRSLLYDVWSSAGVLTEWGHHTYHPGSWCNYDVILVWLYRNNYIILMMVLYPPWLGRGVRVHTTSNLHWDHLPWLLLLLPRVLCVHDPECFFQHNCKCVSTYYNVVNHVQGCNNCIWSSKADKIVNPYFLDK